MPSKIFYSTLGSEFLRICRATSRLEDAIPSTSSLYKRMLNQGARQETIGKTIDKVIRRHPKIFEKYGEDLRGIKP